jgi:hypothetical protein
LRGGGVSVQQPNDGIKSLCVARAGGLEERESLAFRTVERFFKESTDPLMSFRWHGIGCPILHAAVQPIKQPGTGVLPVPANRNQGNAERLGCFLIRMAAEVP